jgi:hypothetical protein
LPIQPLFSEQIFQLLFEYSTANKNDRLFCHNQSRLSCCHVIIKSNKYCGRLFWVKTDFFSLCHHMALDRLGGPDRIVIK